MAARALHFVCLAGIATALVDRSSLILTHTINGVDQAFQLGNKSYLATSGSPLAVAAANPKATTSPGTHIVAISPVITGKYLQDTIARYLAEDDVFSEDFLETLILSSNCSSKLDEAATAFVASVGSQVLMLPSSQLESSMPPPGPLLLESNGKEVTLSKVFRLYTDTYSDFVHGIYESNGTYKVLGLTDTDWGYPLVPVPSRLYSEADPRPLAGARIGVKDIYDVKGLKTTLGSKAWTQMTTEANATAPSIQRIIDLGGIVVGKQKTSQFASAAHAWEWTDVYYPQNPRGDGYLSCSASSAGGGCSIAAYDWLDFAIGSDTGQSMRQPAAFSGTFGNRPSQGLMILDGVMPISYGADTGGVFARDPQDWVKFAKLWYDPSLHQDSSLNGLPELVVPDSLAFPKRILYPTDHLPLQNTAAETVLQSFLAQVNKAMNLTVSKVNITEAVETVTGRDLDSILADLNTIWTYTQLKVVATPLNAHYSPDFPSLDRPFRIAFRNFALDVEGHTEALDRRRQDSDAWHREVLFNTTESCSESVMIYDIGTGGLPSFREAELNESPGAALPQGTGTRGAGSALASYFGSADFTIPIGQVPYYSNITYREEMMPVTINMVARRGCDFVLFNLVEELAKQGVLGPVATGSRTFV
ncbi:amidase signature domain-containing protein [Colletotrichum godetiae]|uniref:Amidase signature domain-containing protein n=1 Tax=Colletotrichum godetiae TaxID=1209918 RepID=A0AAJ0A991_9PEZI|nr:amidase signature domain-containing protein [Colletotrichum godetiae]KAK1658884.1 amidase signature domain-containing protein [Colletotrichum godetiae]